MKHYPKITSDDKERLHGTELKNMDCGIKCLGSNPGI